MDLQTQRLIAAAGGAGEEDVPYIDDVFSTYLYDGDNGTSRLIPNNLDLSGDGGMVIIKRRNANNSGLIFDTARGEVITQ